MKPSPGRIVLYTPPAHEKPANGAKVYVAIVGQVFDETAYINLYVMPPFEAARWVGSVPQEGSAEAAHNYGGGTWTWPPLVKGRA
jgi:hypothetical protein